MKSGLTMHATPPHATAGDDANDADAYGTPGARFWEAHYQHHERVWTGRANPILMKFAAALPPGTALDLGCADGAATIWLARRGWRVTAVDVSATALGRAATHAAAEGVRDQIAFERHDLSESFPAGAYDLVSALYLESPVDFPRVRVLQRAAAAVAPRGLLLVTTHASIAPWSWNQDPTTRFPTPQEALAELELDPDVWHRAFVGAPQRQANGPNGQTALVTDTVLALRRVAARGIDP